MYGYCGLRFVGRVAHPAFFHWLDAPSLFLELFEERRDAFILYADNLSSSLPAGLLACLIIARIIDVDNYYFRPFSAVEQAGFLASMPSRSTLV